MRTLDLARRRSRRMATARDRRRRGDDQGARRFARLLVSEIKLYNEAAVRAGRQQRDLRQRLRAEIDRAQRLYEERVPPAVGARHAYFQQELVQTLADGDPALLGNSSQKPIQLTNYKPQTMGCPSLSRFAPATGVAVALALVLARRGRCAKAGRRQPARRTAAAPDRPRPGPRERRGLLVRAAPGRSPPPA